MRAPKGYDKTNTSEVEDIVKIAKDALWNETLSKEEANKIIDEQNARLKALGVYGLHGVINRK